MPFRLTSGWSFARDVCPAATARKGTADSDGTLGGPSDMTFTASFFQNKRTRCENKRVV
jgi:hypothetical protein